MDDTKVLNPKNIQQYDQNNKRRKRDESSMDTGDCCCHDMHSYLCRRYDEDGDREGTRCEDKETAYHSCRHGHPDHYTDGNSNLMHLILTYQWERKQDK